MAAEGKGIREIVQEALRANPVTLMVFMLIGLGTGAVIVSYLFVAFGIRTGFKANFFETLFLLGVAAYFIVIGGGAVGYSRFRDPVNFLIALWGGMGIEYFITRFRPSEPTQSDKA
jgi:hypothetical protein